MEHVSFDIEGSHLGIGHFSALGIAVCVEFAGDGETGGGRGGGDQLDDGAAAGEWSATPVLGDVTEQAVLDLVPLGGPGWVMANGDGEPGLVGEFLEFQLPQAHAHAVGATTIGRNHQALGIGIALATHRLEPTPDCVDRELGGIVIDADVHPAGIVGEIVDAITG